MDFQEALSRLNNGIPMRRSSWAKECFAYLVEGSTFTVNRKPLLGLFPAGTVIQYRDRLDRMYEDGTFGVYTPTQEDLFALDWERHLLYAPKQMYLELYLTDCPTDLGPRVLTEAQ